MVFRVAVWVAFAALVAADDSCTSPHQNAEDQSLIQVLKGSQTPAPTPNPAACRSWCKRRGTAAYRTTWNIKCWWTGCNDCNECTKCANDCATTTYANWANKCTWYKCSLCTECTSLSNCESWCDTNWRHRWSSKCNWIACRGCTTCTQGSCLSWCSTVPWAAALSWSVKCASFHTCKACPSCPTTPAPATPAPTPAPTPAVTLSGAWNVTSTAWAQSQICGDTTTGSTGNAIVANALGTNGALTSHLCQIIVASFSEEEEVEDFEEDTTITYGVGYSVGFVDTASFATWYASNSDYTVFAEAFVNQSLAILGATLTAIDLQPATNVTTR